MARTPSPLDRLLLRVERLGNRLPHPSLLFLGLCALVLVASALSAGFGAGARHPVSGEWIAARSLLSAEGLRYLLGHLASNFTGFAPVGVAIVALLGLGVAERSGLLGHALGALVRRAPPALLTPVVALAGILSNLAMDAGYVVLIPLAGVLYQLAGRHPVAGVITAFAAVSGGFSANLLLGPIDSILMGMTTEAMQLLDPQARLPASANYWFMAASTLPLVALITLITQGWAEPWLNRHAPWQGSAKADTSPRHPRALRRAGLTALAMLGLYLALSLPAGAPLRNEEGGLLPSSPLLDQIVVLVSLLAAVCGAVYGRSSGRFQHAGHIMEAMEDTMRSLSGYLVLMFFAAQFVAWFNWSHLGLLSAIHGADLLGRLSVSPWILLLGLILLTALLDLLIGSASAKWGVMAPVLVPMLMLAGVPAEQTVAAYRIGDSVTNIITPLMPYFVLILGMVRQYLPQAGLGTLVSLMLPYSLSMLVGWSALLMLWVSLDWPLGF